MTYTVRSGDTLYAISRRYNVSVQTLAHYNNLADPNSLEIGQIIRLPAETSQSGERTFVAKREEHTPPFAERVSRGRREEWGRPWNRIRTQSSRERSVYARSVPDIPKDIKPLPREQGSRDGSQGFLWPIAGEVTSEYGPRRGSFHDGIDISAPRGTEILAVASGEVVFSGALHGYGNIIILQHQNGYATVYAHNEKNLVDEGRWVRQGQVVARVGDTGRANGPHLHFEVRKDNLARNPLMYLPADRRTVSRSR